MYGHVYVVMFNNGTVKVGMTSSVGSRIYAISNAAKAFDIDTTKIFLSSEVGQARKLEAKLLSAFSEECQDIKGEYFKEVDEELVRNLLRVHNVGFFEFCDIKMRSLDGSPTWTGTFISDNLRIGKKLEFASSGKVREKIIKVIGDGKTKGVLMNRLRKFNRNIVENELDSLVKENVLSIEVRPHKRSLVDIQTYKIAE